MINVIIHQVKKKWDSHSANSTEKQGEGDTLRAVVRQEHDLDINKIK